jgi:hypothetical protein
MNARKREAAHAVSLFLGNQKSTITKIRHQNVSSTDAIVEISGINS